MRFKIGFMINEESMIITKHGTILKVIAWPFPQFNGFF